MKLGPERVLLAADFELKAGDTVYSEVCSRNVHGRECGTAVDQLRRRHCHAQEQRRNSDLELNLTGQMVQAPGKVTSAFRASCAQTGPWLF